MRLPYVVVDQLDSEQIEKWEKFFGDEERPRYLEEGIWRRTQEEVNAAESGWTGEGDARRRLVHYRYEYGLCHTTGAPALALKDFYLFHSVAAPFQEAEAASKGVRDALLRGGWQRVQPGLWGLGDLRCQTVSYDRRHPQDEKAGRVLPDGYMCVDTMVFSKGYSPSRATRDLPWMVMAQGMRMPDQRGNPTVVDDLSELVNYLPFQVELGCGISTEAGIPPLHRLHEVYRVTERDAEDFGGAHRFTINPTVDPLLAEVLANTDAKFEELVEMYRACFLAEPPESMLALRELVDAGHLVGPVINNNFDLLAARLGLEECYVRRYDEKVPAVPILPEAKALLVVGLHADRRKVQQRARDAGMKVFYVDPEGFVGSDGKLRPYLVEGARDGDFMCHATAQEALTGLARMLRAQG